MELSLVLRSPGWLKYYNLDRNDAYIYTVIIQSDQFFTRAKFCLSVDGSQIWC